MENLKEDIDKYLEIKRMLNNKELYPLVDLSKERREFTVMDLVPIFYPGLFPRSVIPELEVNEFLMFSKNKYTSEQVHDFMKTTKDYVVEKIEDETTFH